MRINTRPDESRSQVKGRRPAPAKVLAEAGFIGCGDTSPDLSDRYKEDVRSPQSPAKDSPSTAFALPRCLLA